MLETRDLRSVLITSALNGEGKTLVACNLALALASMAGERRIALLDLDLRRPTISTCMGIAPRFGIERVLRGEIDLRCARIRTNLSALDLFLARNPVPHAHEVLAGSSLPLLIEELSRHYRTIVCDTPPTLVVPDVELIAPHVGGCVLVARAGVTRRSPFREMLALLPQDKLIGSFLNYARLHRSVKYYEYYAGEDEPEDVPNQGSAAAADRD